jgi:hypothetical protein
MATRVYVIKLLFVLDVVKSLARVISMPFSACFGIILDPILVMHLRKSQKGVGSWPYLKLLGKADKTITNLFSRQKGNKVLKL